MVISEKNKYCFIEYPRSASYAIRNELLEYYDGQDHLEKHGRLKDFQKSLPNTYKDYFVFCSIRNPMRDIVSIYNVNKNNNSGRATPEFWKDYKWYLRYRELRRAKFFNNDGDTSFPKFFDTLFKLPYVKPRIIAELNKNSYDYIIRVESLQEDFSNVLEMLKIKKVRDVPRYNVSTKKENDIDSFYPPHVRKKAVRVLGPMMKFMGYEFPDSWQVKHIPISSKVYFAFIKPLAIFFWNFVKYK